MSDDIHVLLAATVSFLLGIICFLCGILAASFGHPVLAGCLCLAFVLLMILCFGIGIWYAFIFHRSLR